MPPGHPCLFPFSYFLRFVLSFCRPLFSPSFSFRFFVLWFSVCFLYRLLHFFFRFPALLGGGFCSFASVLHPPRAACEPASLRIPLVYCLFYFLAFLSFTCFIFLLFLPFFFDFDLDVVFFILSGSCVYYLLCLLGFGSCCVCVLHIKPLFLPVDIQHT